MHLRRRTTASRRRRSRTVPRSWRKSPRAEACPTSRSTTRTTRLCCSSRGRSFAGQSGIAYSEGAAGLAVAVGGKLVSVDLFDAPETCRKVWPRVISGMVLDAMEEQGTGAISEADVEAAVDTLRTAPWQPVTAAGAGED